MKRRLHGAIGAIPAALALLAAFGAGARVASPHAIDIPPWFEETFLSVPEDVAEAARSGRRLMLYFGQDGCPYCKRLMQTNFTQKPIVDKTRRHFVAVALNIWGDREVTWFGGKTMPEKEFARLLGVQFTPTILFFDEKGKIVVRLNGYYPPHRFEAAIDYVAGRMEGKRDFAEYMRASAKEPASAALHDEPFFVKPPHDFRARTGSRPLAVLFETPHCAGCDEWHAEGFRRADVKALLARFDVVRFALAERTPVVTPEGRKTSAGEWARSLAIAYTPSIVFFEGGREVFRVEAYVRPFHLASAFEYVASGAFRAEPSFQRFVQVRAERLRGRGETVDLWR